MKKVRRKLFVCVEMKGKNKLITIDLKRLPDQSLEELINAQIDKLKETYGKEKIKFSFLEEVTIEVTITRTKIKRP